MTLSNFDRTEIAQAIWADDTSKTVGFNTRDGHFVIYEDGRTEFIDEHVYRQILLLDSALELS